jgi:lipopolysaccharide transport system ATP-binding protein
MAGQTPDSPVVVRVIDVGKRYRLGVINRQQLTDDFKAFVARMRRKPDPTVPVGAEVDPQRIGEDFWALRHISFEVRQGEVLGIIGHNGAGKSTLLKLLSRITLPTEGVIKMRGKMSSLLEVGTGFHPELTGRDNIYLNGAILGMRRHEVDARIEEIIAFSGIKHHIDTPVKRYSSGMRVRLGFAVAAHLEPEILIIDEVLSVGDAEFQRRSMGKMKQSAQSGRTVLFVSHNMTAVRSLCSRVIWLERGRVRLEGPTEEVVAAYQTNYIQATTERKWSRKDAPGSEEALLYRVCVRPGGGGDQFRWEDTVEVAIDMDVHQVDDLAVSIQVLNRDDQVVFTTNTLEGMPNVPLKRGAQTLECHFPDHILNEGEYYLNVVVTKHARVIFRVDHVVKFTLIEPPRTTAWHGRRKGIFRLQLPWRSVPAAPPPGSLIQ